MRLDTLEGYLRFFVDETGGIFRGVSGMVEM